ncbi:MAG: hypothetical protein ACM3NQ_10205 [Bacteroidales bacterium]
MDEKRHGRGFSAAGRESDTRSAAPVDDVSVVPAHQPDLAPHRTIAPPVVPSERGAGESPAAEPGRSRLRAVERSADERSRRDPVGTAVETVGAAVGWTTGYVKSRRPAQIRSDAERFVVASPALALVAALGFGYLLGSYIRR